MPDETSPAKRTRSGSPRALLEGHGLHAKRQFGQNFLSDPELCARIALSATGPLRAATVLEIGAGLGALTGPLLERSERVLALEKDRELIPLLGEIFASEVAEGRLNIEEADIRDVDLSQKFADTARPRIVAGNLPYLITGPILRALCALGREIDRACVMVQLEVAERLTAKPGSEAYGALTVFVQAQFIAQKAFVIRKGAFFPSPKVDSAVVVLQPHPTPVAEETPQFQRVVQAAFQQRRKKLRTAWGQLVHSPEVLAQAASRAEIDLNLRGEVLSVQQFARMAEELTK